MFFIDDVSIICTASCVAVPITSTSTPVAIDTQRPFFTFADASTNGSTITFAGGTLKITGTTTTGQAITITATGGKIDSNGNIVYLTGAITGTGPLTVSGTTGGEVHVNSTVIVPVTVDNTGTLRGTGTISGATTVAGTLSPGNSPGTLTFTAPVTMQSGSTLALDIDGTGTGTGAGNYSRAIVSVSTFAAAGTLAPKLRGITYASTEAPGTNSYTPPLGQRFAGVVQATGGVTGSFTSLTQPDGLRAGTRFDAVYNPASIDLYVTPSSYGNLPAAGVAQTRNQSSLGSALDAMRPVAGIRTTGDTKTLFDALAPLDGAALPRALTQIAGEGNANLPLTAVDVGRAFGASVATRLGQTRGGSASLAEQASRDLTSLRFGTTGGVSGGYAGMTDPEAVASARRTERPSMPALATIDPDFVGPVPAANTPAGWAVGSGLAAGDGGPAEPLGLWARGFGQFTDLRGDGNNPGFNRTIAGGLAGGDLPVLGSG